MRLTIFIHCSPLKDPSYSIGTWIQSIFCLTRSSICLSPSIFCIFLFAIREWCKALGVFFFFFHVDPNFYLIFIFKFSSLDPINLALWWYTHLGVILYILLTLQWVLMADYWIPLSSCIESFDVVAFYVPLSPRGILWKHVAILIFPKFSYPYNDMPFHPYHYKGWPSYLYFIFCLLHLFPLLTAFSCLSRWEPIHLMFFKITYMGAKPFFIFLSCFPL